LERIPVALVYAIMREESQFRPAVESPAEAVGLMQIIPPTAALIAARLEGRKVDPEALDDPNHNIALGTWYLAGLSKRYDAQLPLVMAAYNAGPAAADGWIRRANSLQMDLTQFMEEVPYKETRGYVKRVSRSLAVYRMLYGLERGTFSPMVQGLVQNKISGDLSF
jgi:soluble lytic murein transglycosylase